MRWTTNTNNFDVWQRWFAWHPVRIDTEWVFWEWVERRLQWSHSYDGIDAKWFYR